MTACESCLEYCYRDGRCQGVAGQAGPSHAVPTCFVGIVQRPYPYSAYADDEGLTARPDDAPWCHTVLGWSFTPLHGKRPYLECWTLRPRETVRDLFGWLQSGNVGLRTGRASGVIVIDLDADEPRYSVAAVGTLGLNLDTVIARTGGGGWHVYYRLPAGMHVANSISQLAPGVDVRGEGGQVVFPGSIHPQTGTRYAWEEGHAPSEMKLADLPPALLERLASLDSHVRDTTQMACPQLSARELLAMTDPKSAANAEVRERSAAQWALQQVRT